MDQQDSYFDGWRRPSFIQKAMGHESITTTARIYAHLYDDELDVIAAALDGLRDGGDSE